MKTNRLIISILSNIIAFSISFSMSFIITPYLINSIGKEAYSFYPIANNLISYVNILTIALNSMSSRFITIELERNNLSIAQSYYSSVFFTNIVLVIIILLPTVIGIINIDHFMNIPINYVKEVKVMMFLIFISIFIDIISSVFNVSNFAKNRMDLIAFRDILQNMIKCILIFVLFVLFKPSLIYLGIISLILSIFKFLVQYIVTKKIMPEISITIKSFSLNKIKELLSSGVWNSINSLGSLLMLSMSLFIANKFVDASASGNLSIVQTLPNLLTSIICAIYSVFMPRITKIYAQYNKELLIDEVEKSQKILGLISTTPVILIILFGGDFFELWVPNENSIYLHTISIITVLPLLIHGNMWTIYGLNTVFNKIKLPSILLIIFGILNISITIFLLRYTNIDGLFIITVVSSSLNILYYLIFIPIYASFQLKISIFRFHFNIIKQIVFSIFIIIIGINIKNNLIVIESWVDFFCISFIYAVVILFINLLTYNIDKIMYYLKKKE